MTKSDSIYVRSVATRSSSGSIPSIILTLQAIYCLIHLIWLLLKQWVQVNQVRLQHSNRIVVVEGPARGDGIQAEKAGLLELQI